jgi:hypothetical protein
MTLQRSGILAGAAALSLIFSAGEAAWGGTPPPGYVDASTFGFNSTDATAALQAAIETGQDVWVPKESAPWYVTGINLDKSNQTILFESGAQVKAKKGAFLDANDRLFTAKNVSNVTLDGYGATFLMNRTDYVNAPYEQGEWRHGIGLYSVNGFTVKGLTISDTGGDGIYVGSTSSTGYSQGVTIQDVTLKTNYRNGISVISADGMTIDNATILDTARGTGTAPKDGIDFEPNYSGQILKDITVKNSVIAGSAIDGLNFSTKKNPNANISNVVLDHNTFYNNRARGMVLQVPEPGIMVKNSLFVSNHQYGVLEKETSTNPDQSIDYSAFWANTLAPVSGLVTVGPGSLTSTQVQFYSTSYSSPYFLYLSPNVSSLISEGADDGTYMGARPIYTGINLMAVPEPSTVALLGVAGLMMLRRRKGKEELCESSAGQ